MVTRKLRSSMGSSGARSNLPPEMLLVLLAVLLPTLVLLWVVVRAASNESAAVRQNLADLSRSHLAALRSKLNLHWEEKALRLSQTATNSPPAERFRNLVAMGLCDSVLVRTSAGEALYPAAADGDAGAGRIPDSEAAVLERAEMEASTPAEAAAALSRIAGAATNNNMAAVALRNRARCLAQAGDELAAVGIVAGPLLEQRYANARDTTGRLVVPGAQLFALQLLCGSNAPAQVLDVLVARLNDYGDGTLPSPQRLFLMEEVAALRPEVAFPTIDAERIAAACAADTSACVGATTLVPCSNDALWMLCSPDMTVVGLITRARVDHELQSLSAGHPLLAGCSIVAAPQGERRGGGLVASLPAGPAMRGWDLRVEFTGEDPFTSAARRRVATYLWAAVLAVVAVGVLMVLATGAVGRQVRLARLKNDFLATVSHELKTPLSSCRALVDTLLDGNLRDERQTREYLDLIARENERLSRLVGGFLTFSRMERNKNRWDLLPVAPGDIASAALASLPGDLRNSDCDFASEVAPGLPLIAADKDAMVTVLLNLLDNASKYTEGRKEIRLRVSRGEGDIRFAVTDNGIGIPRRYFSRIFDRFFQVDRTLSRRAGGCGLGLSIVKFIVEAHGGVVDVASVAGRGSTFTVRIPAIEEAKEP